MEPPHTAITTLVERRGAPAWGEQSCLELRYGELTQTFALPSVTLGSSRRCEFTVADPTVSSEHARIVIEDGVLVIRDLGSRNGTLVDGVRVDRAFLDAGARLMLGDAQIDVRITDERKPFEIHQVSAFGRLRGTSLPMRRMFAILERVCPTDAFVLVLGESGTGKELVAEAIHERSRRAAEPLVVVDCGSLPPTLIESELFGHERGAFTGAQAARAGAFERAHGGTLLLDEIGELELSLQPRLLRALDARKVKRLGGDDYRDVDVRVIAATHRDLATMVNTGDFREDLYHRLAVIEVRVPPLRERRGDLEVLGRLFAEQLSELHELPSTKLDGAWFAALEARKWPGNVRELRNHIERALLLGSLDTPVQEELARTTTLATQEVAPYAVARQQVIEQFEREYVSAALARAGNNVARAARETKLERSYLFKLIKRHKLRVE